jgi:hypothetical protein
MRCQWDERLVDKVSSFLIRVGLGLQPSTCASSGRGGKIDEQRLVLSPGLFKGGVGVFNPVDEHSSSFGLTFLVVRGTSRIIALDRE